MTTRLLRGAALALLAASTAALAQPQAFDLTRLATCQDSWLEWSKTDPARFERTGQAFRLAYARDAADDVFKPKTPTTLLGFPVVGVDPQSVGMGVGFSVQVKGAFDAVRPAFEKAVGKGTCKIQRDPGGSQACEIKVRDEGTALMATAGKDETLIACYYKYEK